MQRSFSRRAPGLAAGLAGLAGLVLLAGCGSSKHAASSTAATNPTTPPTATSTTSSSAPQTTPSTPTATTRTGTTPTARTTSSSNPTGGAGLPSGSGSSGGSGSGGGSSGGGATNARVPATFTIASGGRLSPPTVSAPAFLAVQLTIVSRDGQVHHVLLGTPTPHKLTVPADSHATVLIPGLRAGNYPLEIDGARRGALSIGGEPGP